MWKKQLSLECTGTPRTSGSMSSMMREKGLTANKDVEELRYSLDQSRKREALLLAHLEKLGFSSGDIESSIAINPSEILAKESSSFYQGLFERASWLSGLLILQSFSTLILASNQLILEKHPTVIYFLTALVGAGGNAGNQASVRVIRGLALKTLTANTMRSFLMREAFMAVLLALSVGFIGFCRAMLSPCSTPELVAVVFSLMAIVFISVIVGALLPLFLNAVRVDPAHAATSVQVIMDICGVFVTLVVTKFLLDSSIGKYIMAPLMK